MVTLSSILGLLFEWPVSFLAYSAINEHSSQIVKSRFIFLCDGPIAARRVFGLNNYEFRLKESSKVLCIVHCGPPLYITDRTGSFS
jgi:hypothetical protein